ncbi:MAG: creatininase family protein [Chloroflexi bacterium]|nr:creatininase family protein [Chloroflexota bacterium]
MSNPLPEKVHHLDLRPEEFRTRLADRPIGYLPLGTLEWHGEHLPLGSDALIAAGLFARAAARFGGIVLPPLFLGPDRSRRAASGETLVGMEYADSTTPPRRLDGALYWIPRGLFLLTCEAILAQAVRTGFRVIVADGHGPSRRAWADHAEGWEQQFGIRLVSVTRDLAGLWRSQMDHAARNETALVQALWPDLVDLERLESDRAIWPQGVAGEDPRDASAAHGEDCIEASLDALGALLDRIAPR